MFEISEKDKNSKFQSASHPEFSGTQQLLDSEIGLIRYTTGIVNLFYNEMKLSECILKRKGKILEFGAGTGFLAELFRDKFKINPDCVELDPNLMEMIRTRGFTSYRTLLDTKQEYEAIYSSNVLEHIEDDKQVLLELFNSLTPGGVIGIYVPAHPFLFSKMDEIVGHVRRYTRKELDSKIESTGFVLEKSHYVDSLGFLAAIIVVFMGYKSRANLGGTKSLEIYDRYIYPLSKVLDRIGFKNIMGKNIIVVARKPG